MKTAALLLLLGASLLSICASCKRGQVPNVPRSKSLSCIGAAEMQKFVDRVPGLDNAFAGMAAAHFSKLLTLVAETASPEGDYLLMMCDFHGASGALALVQGSNGNLLAWMPVQRFGAARVPPRHRLLDIEEWRKLWDRANNVLDPTVRALCIDYAEIGDNAQCPTFYVVRRKDRTALFIVSFEPRNQYLGLRNALTDAVGREAFFGDYRALDWYRAGM